MDVTEYPARMVHGEHRVVYLHVFQCLGIIAVRHGRFRVVLYKYAEDTILLVRTLWPGEQSLSGTYQSKPVK